MKAQVIAKFVKATKRYNRYDIEEGNVCQITGQPSGVVGQIYTPLGKAPVQIAGPLELKVTVEIK